MFNFMKKGDEKEKRKKDKDEKKKRERDGGSSDETARFDDMRRSLKMRRRKEKLPSGITADYTGNLFAELSKEPDKSASLPGYASRSDSSEASINSLPQAKVLPPLPPRPPKRGILKGARSTPPSDIYDGDISNPMLLVKNTLQNEVIAYQNLDTDKSQPSSCLYLNTAEKSLNVASSAESLTDTTNSSFATPPLLSPAEQQPRTSPPPPPPPLIPLKLPSPRQLTIFRTARGDFGFQLRRAVVTDKLSAISRKEVLFAEPGSLGGHVSDTGLLPGDVLLEVNDCPVFDTKREQIIAMIKNSGPFVKVKVQPIAELSEVTKRCRQEVEDVGEMGMSVGTDRTPLVTGATLKRSASLRFKATEGRSEEELAKEKEWLETERIWLIHRSGFSTARLLSASATSSATVSDGKVKIRLENSEEVLEVEEEEIERCNPGKLDLVERLEELRYVNECSVLHVLRQRLANNLIHTYAADSLVVINPECPLSIYNEKVASLFVGCEPGDMPPHIYATAQAAYKAISTTRRDQSIVLLGRSGSGKTHNFKHLLSYILIAAGSSNKSLTMEKLASLHTVLEAFGNAATLQNANATRSTNLISVDFDSAKHIASASIQIVMIERGRVTRRASGEASFNVFYYLLAGAEGQLSKQLFFDALLINTNLFFTQVTKNDERTRCQVEFAKLCEALKCLGASEKEINVIWSVLASIYHLGYAGVVQVGTSKWQFEDPVSATRASRLLGCTSEELAAAIWDVPLSPSHAHSHAMPSAQPQDGLLALEGFAQGLYSELVTIVNAVINRCYSTTVNTIASLVILDCPGLQTPSAATFSDLCHNYVQERLHLLYHNTTLLAPLDRYTQDRVDVKIEELYTEQVSSSQLVAMLDKPPPGGVLKTSQTDLRDSDRRGILWLAEEEIIYPSSSDDTLLQHIFQQYSSKEFTRYIQRGSGTGQVCIQHLGGTSPVMYNVRGWLSSCREPRTVRAALTLLQQSSREHVSELFVVGRGGGGMYTPDGGSQSLRRVSSIRRTCSAAVKRKSLGLQVKHTTDSIIETLRRTRSRFVVCIAPQQWSGLTEPSSNTSPSSSLVNIPLLRSQIRGAEIVAAVRLIKQGFPEFIPHAEFVRRFKLLAGGSGGDSDATPVPASNPSKRPNVTLTPANNVGVGQQDEASLVAEILFRAEVEEAAFRIGLSQVFLRCGVVTQLEVDRDEKLSGVMTGLQARCRGYLARKKLAKLRVQDTAVRCIQRNVRKLMQIREWPWWKLYVNVTPLLGLNSNEHVLQQKLKELEETATRLNKIEAENNTLKLNKDQLEAKLNEMMCDLSEERGSLAQTSERLEAETSQRIRLEQELTQLNKRKLQLESTTDRLEMELHYARATDNCISDFEDVGDERGNSDVFKKKIDRLKRENELLRQQLRQQHEDDLEQLVALKKQLEKRLTDANEEVEEQRKVVMEWKKKTQKVQNELADSRILIQEEYSRNALLEKKQRRFDAELHNLEKSIREEKGAKERIARERDVAVGANILLEQTLSGVRSDLEQKEAEVKRLREELDFLANGGATEQEITHLKKTKLALDQRLKDLESELDQVCGTLSLAEGAKLKLELSLEIMRNEHNKELSQREEEFQDLQSNLCKKLKAAEAAWQSESDERAAMCRERNELLRRVADLEEQERMARAEEEDALLKLKRDLRKTKALLQDAQVMLDKAREEHPSRDVIKTLKNKLDDAESRQASAMKARQKMAAELAEVTGQLEEMETLKREAEKRAQTATRQITDFKSQLEDNEEELSELMKKYQQHISTEESRHKESEIALAELEAERDNLRLKLSEAMAKLETLSMQEPLSADTCQSCRRHENLVQDLKNRREFEEAVQKRLETQLSRSKEQIERMNEQLSKLNKDSTSLTEQVRKLQSTLRDSKEESLRQEGRIEDLKLSKKEVDDKLSEVQKDLQAERAKTRLAEDRLSRLQLALNTSINDTDSEPSEEDDS